VVWDDNAINNVPEFFASVEKARSVASEMGMRDLDIAQTLTSREKTTQIFIAQSLLSACAI